MSYKEPEPNVDHAIRSMQKTSKQLLAICADKLDTGKMLDVMELKELREVLETIALGLDHDSLLCQQALDDSDNETDLDGGEPSEYSWPASSPELHWTECLSRKDHIETFWGIDYDSDALPNFSD
ncbi:hypothetical protein U9M48_023253 [Paspalum notatum var. saurae]|uniref:Uncharacterized protein n=1 Tax=Paspalum notatum var. saurae TaxID=547442 RepID=A0AAQ3WVY9_PASNO